MDSEKISKFPMVSIPIEENGLLAIKAEQVMSPPSNEADISLDSDTSSSEQYSSDSCERVCGNGKFNHNSVYFLTMC